MEKNEYLTIKEASQFLNVHPETLRNWEKIGIITPMKFGSGKHRRFTKEMLLGCIK